MRKVIILLLVGVAVLGTQAYSEQTATKNSPRNLWSKEKAWRWYWKVSPLRGCNYLPRTAVNMTEMWQADTFDPKTINEELGWAEKAGYNSVRIFLPYLVWKDDPQGIKKRLNKFLTIADKHGIGSMVILFCDCAFAGREPYLGKQDEPVPGV
ncbi:MAG TPA: 1,4-beta-xylanase, partial [Planctomycetes bacterium]|nr:1,4-beta-xylanase [Planctomycetota bacterium]